MKKVRTVVKPGICNFNIIIETCTLENGLLQLKFISGCKMVKALNDDFANPLNWKKGVLTKMLESYIYKICSTHLKHNDCPLPCAISKSIQVAIGAALEQEVHIEVREVKD